LSSAESAIFQLSKAELAIFKYQFNLQDINIISNFYPDSVANRLKPFFEDTSCCQQDIIFGKVN